MVALGPEERKTVFGVISDPHPPRTISSLVSENGLTNQATFKLGWAYSQADT